jgi:predicted transcriptional regulator
MKSELSKRERQIVEILYRRGQATAADVQEDLADGSSYSAVRGMLRVLTEKGLATYRQEGAKYVYAASTPKEEAARSAVDRVVDTFFAGSVEQMVATLISERERHVSPEELDRLAQLIKDARKGLK